jgi:hypothetical protein
MQTLGANLAGMVFMGPQGDAQRGNPDADKRGGDVEMQGKLIRYTELLAIVGALQVVVLFGQGSVFWRTLRQMSKTAERQLRAYICLDSAVLSFLQPSVAEVEVTLKNCGQTPAYDFRGWLAIWFAEYPPNRELPGPTTSTLRKGTKALGPGGVVHFVAGPGGPALPPQSIALLGTAKSTLYIYGEVYYRDAFGKSRWTKYRYLCKGAEDIRKVPGTAGGSLKPDAEGNDAN